MSGPHARLSAVVVTVLLMAAATGVYYLIPVPALGPGAWTVLFFAGAGLLGVLILVAVRQLLRAGEEAGIRGLVLLLTLTVLFFSWSDASVAKLHGQFTDLHDRTDALYFNISTLATVGFGDIHPAGQLARAAVTLQIVFNLVFLGAAVSMITSTFRRRTQVQQPESGHGGEHGTG